MRLLNSIGLMLILALTSTGCSIRQAEDAPPPLDPETKMFALDPANVSVADRTATMEQFPDLLVAVGKNHSYHQWDEEFIDSTTEEVSTLLPGEALEEMFYTESDRGLEEVRIRLMMVEENIAQVRLTTSNPQVAQVLQADMNKAVPNPPEVSKALETLSEE